MKYIKLLLVFISAIGVILTAMFLPSYLRKNKVVHTVIVDHPEEDVGESLEYGNVEEIAKILDSPDITLESLAQISKTISSRYPEKLELYSGRIQALRMLLLCFATSPHTRQRLDNALTVSFDNLSPSQRQMLLPYQNGGEKVREKWETLPPVLSITEFSKKISQ